MAGGLRANYQLEIVEKKLQIKFTYTVRVPSQPALD